jgi:hypothetical protein
MRLYPLLGVFLFLFTARAAEETAIVAEGKINVRGQPSLIGEVVTQLEQGNQVTVLERITNSTPRTPGEPTNWAKIKLPPNTPVWVFAPFVKDGVVSVSRLNVRGGRGENYSVLGRMNRGEAVKAIQTVEEWMEIEPPTNAYAFVDLSLLQFGVQAPPPTVAANAPQTSAPQSLPTSISPEPAQPPTNTVVEAPSVATTVTNVAPEPVVATATPEISTNTVAASTPEAPAAPASAQASVTITNEAPSVTIVPAQPGNEVPAATAPAVEPPAPSVVAATNNSSGLPKATSPEVATAAPATSQALPQVAPEVPKVSRPLPKRVVRREGIVRPTTSIQAPTWYELVHAETKKRINYLFEENMGINLKDYRGQRVVVSGEEAIDARWPNTPILDMQTLDVLPDEGR